MARHRTIGLVEQIADVTEYFQGRIVRQVFLQIAVATIHRAIAREVDHEIIAAHLPFAPRALFEEIPFVFGENKRFFCGAEVISSG
jgi:hypothetical protein